MPERLVCPRCGVPFAAGEAVCPRDGTPRPGVRTASPAPQATRRPTGRAPVLDEEPSTEQAGLSELHARFALPKISKPEPQRLRRLPGIESDPAVSTVSVAPEITPVTGAPAVKRGGAADEAHDELVGQKVGDYVIKQRIGVGGMGVVYGGVQPLIGASVAIKVLRPEAAGDPKQIDRLLSEARVVNAIRHRGLVDIFNFAQLPDGRHCVVMELLSGESLEEVLQRRKRLPLAEALPLFEEVLDALAAAHKAGVIHRDIKPSNIFVVEQHGRRYAKVLDFGIAKQSVAPDGMVAQTVMTRFMGTPGFVAPEQARAQPVGPVTDLYALGVVMFLAVTGRPPFEGKTSYELVRQHVETPPPRPLSFEPTIPAGLDALLLSLMAKLPQDRPQSAEAVRDKLAQLRASLAGANSTKPPLDVDGMKETRMARPPRPGPRIARGLRALAPWQKLALISAGFLLVGLAAYLFA